MKRQARTGLWIGLGVVVAALLAAGIGVFSVYTPLAGRLTPRDARVIIINGGAVPDAAALVPFSALETLDLTGATAEAAHVDALRTAYPQLHIVWRVPLSSGAVSNDAASVRLRTADDIALLPYFDSLHEATAEAGAVCPALLEAISAYPACAFSYQVAMGGQLLGQDVTEAVLDGSVTDATQMADALVYLPKLNTLTLTDVPEDREVVTALLAQRRGLNILWEDPLFGASDSAAETVCIDTPCGDAKALANYLSCFAGLRTADVRQCPLTNADAAALALRFPTVALTWMVDVDGVKVDSAAEQLSWENVPIQDYAAFGDALAYLPALRRIEMDGCGLSDSQLGALSDRYPDILFVWTLQIRNEWTVRTDAKVFSTKQLRDNTKRLKSEDVQILRCCRNLIALDLGHNAITDLSWLSSLTDLQVLILGDNPISDLSPLQNLSKLKYLEAFQTSVSDIRAVCSLPELLDINLCFSNVSDTTSLLTCETLERIWLAGCEGITEENIQQLQSAFPNAEFDFTSGGSTAKGWREHERYFAYRKMFQTGEPVAPFLP